MRIPAFVLTVLLAAACSNSSPSAATHPKSSPTGARTAANATPRTVDDASSPPVINDNPAIYTNGGNGDTARRFASPSGNIRCSMESSDDVDWVTCLVRQKTWHGPNCVGAKVTSIELQADAHTRSDVTCEPDDQEVYRTIPYGHAITEIEITCTSRPEGMTCRVGDHGHGFTVSRERYQSD